MTRFLTSAEFHALMWLNSQIDMLERDLKDMIARSRSAASENYGAHYSGLADGLSLALEQAHADRDRLIVDGFGPGDNRAWLAMHLREAAYAARPVGQFTLDEFEYMCMLRTGTTIDLEG